nr:hypothetical protein [uncultured Chryseobacterium sp.]
MAAITAAMWANTPEDSNSYWFNNGSGFTSYDGGDKGGKAGGGSLAYGSTVSYGSIFTMGDGIYTLPPLVLNGYGSSKNWGVTVNNYNNNHNILYNGIAGMQSAWNNANRPFDPVDWVKGDKGGLETVSILSVPYMILGAVFTEGLMQAGMDGNTANTVAETGMLLYAMKAPQGIANRLGAVNNTNNIANSGKNIWTATKKLSSVKNAFGHWSKHKSEFPELLNAKQYVDATRNFLHNTPMGTLIKVRPNGEVLKYDAVTNTFGVMTAAGVPKTMFRPADGMQWLRQ